MKEMNFCYVEISTSLFTSQSNPSNRNNVGISEAFSNKRKQLTEMPHSLCQLWTANTCEGSGELLSLARQF